MKTTQYFCDDCLKPKTETELQIIREFHFRQKCIDNRLNMSIKLYVPARNCPLCKGKGYTENITNYDPCGRNEYEKKPCDHYIIRPETTAYQRAYAKFQESDEETVVNEGALKW